MEVDDNSDDGEIIFDKSKYMNKTEMRRRRILMKRGMMVTVKKIRRKENTRKDVAYVFD